MGYGLAFDGYLISKPLNQAVILLIKHDFASAEVFFFTVPIRMLFMSPLNGVKQTPS